jgi:signal peptidase II
LGAWGQICIIPVILALLFLLSKKRKNGNCIGVKYIKFYLAALVVIAFDQLVKLLVHFNMEPGMSGEIYVFGEWFRLHYLLNPGMAFGLKLDWEWGKLLLTLFRMAATVGIAYYIYLLITKKAHPGLIWSMALILGGAVGNLIDSIFYGVLLEGNAVPGAPTPWFHGQVVDMLYFPLYEGYLPEWIPLWSGQYFIFFRPVFNIADSAIFIGVALILIMQRRFFAEADEAETNKKYADAQQVSTTHQR